jgi:ligand-binding SRPBCC domain-containing protein
MDREPYSMRARTYRLERQQLIPRPRPEVFAFFAKAENLESLTPGFLRFQILTPLPIRMQPGTCIDYRLRLFAVPIRWRTLIETFDPPHTFTDIQVRGPYQCWHHCHEFSEAPGGTLVVDRVDYELPGGWLGALAHALWVRRTLARIFDYRYERLQTLFASSTEPAR